MVFSEDKSGGILLVKNDGENGGVVMMMVFECAVIGDANLGIRSTPLATSSDSQHGENICFLSSTTVASTLQPNIVTTDIIPMQKPTFLNTKGRVQKPESRNLSARGVPPPHYWRQ